eukprot:scaffold124537_cov63-Phaeocystis_antarctica.AAC.1
MRASPLIPTPTRQLMSHTRVRSSECCIAARSVASLSSVRPRAPSVFASAWRTCASSGCSASARRRGGSSSAGAAPREASCAATAACACARGAVSTASSTHRGARREAAA